MPSRFSHYLDNLSFRAVLLATLLVICAFFVVRPNIHGDFSDKNCDKTEEFTQDREQSKIFFGLSPEGWTALFTFGLFVATIALFVATYALFETAARDSDKTEDALEIARTSAEASLRSANIAKSTLVSANRAWITGGIKGEIISFENNTANTAVAFTFKNVGNSPALNISIEAWLIGAFHNGRGFRELQKERCETSKNRGEQLFSFALFPGESFPEAADFRGIGIRASMTAENFIDSQIIDEEGSRSMIIFLGGCINYSFATDSSVVHQTSFMHQLNPAVFPPTAFFDIDAGAQEYILGSLPLGDGRNAD